MGYTPEDMQEEARRADRKDTSEILIWAADEIERLQQDVTQVRTLSSEIIERLVSSLDYDDEYTDACLAFAKALRDEAG